MHKFEIWDHWTKLGEVEAYTPEHALRVFRKNVGYGWVKLFAYMK